MVDTLNTDEDAFFNKYRPNMDEGEFFNKFNPNSLSSVQDRNFQGGPYNAPGSDSYWSGSSVGRILSAFGQGASESWGAHHDTALGGEFKWEAEHKDEDHSIVYGLHTSWGRPLAAAIDTIARPFYAIGGGVSEALGASGEELGKAAETVEETSKRNGPNLTIDTPWQQVNINPGTLLSAPLRYGEEYLKDLSSGAGMESHVPDMTQRIFEARARGVIGEGEKGFYGTVKPTPEQIQARITAASDAGYGPETVEQWMSTKHVPDTKEIARMVDPDTFKELDRLQELKENLQLSIQQELTKAREETQRLVEQQGIAETPPKPEPLIVSRRAPDGTITYGKPGELHSDLFNSDRAYELATDDQMGFSEYEGGKFLSRKEAFDLIKDREASVVSRRGYPEEALEANSYFTERAKEPETQIKELKPSPALKKTIAGVQELQERLVDTQGKLTDILSDTRSAELRGQELLESQSPEGNAFRDLIQSHALEKAIQELQESPVHAQLQRQIWEAKKAEAEKKAELAPKIQKAYTDTGKIQDVKTPSDKAESQPGSPLNKTPSASQQILEADGPRKLEGVVEGPEKESAINRKLEAENIDKGLEENTGKDTGYSTITHESQGEKALDYAESNWQAALEVAMGDRQAPSGVYPEAVLAAVKRIAEIKGDVETTQALARTRLGREGSIMGQRIGLLRNLYDALDPSAIIQHIQNAWENKGKSEMEKTMSEIKRSQEEATARFSEDYKTFLKSIECEN